MSKFLQDKKYSDKIEHISVLVHLSNTQLSSA